MIHENFNDALFAGRRINLDQIVGWWQDPHPIYRVCSVVGPPGIGKSWLAIKVQQLIECEPGSLVLPAYLSLDSITGQPHDDLVSNDGRGEWLKSAIARAIQKCDWYERDFARQVDFYATVANLVEKLCEYCGQVHAPLLIVDGFEEIKENERKWLNYHLLRPFIGRGCTRILITRRAENSLQWPELSITEWVYHLGPLSVQDGDEQLKKRTEESSSAGEFTQQLKAALPGYEWNYAAINSWLHSIGLERWKKDGRVNFSAEDLKICLQSLVAPYPISPEALNCLRGHVRIARRGIIYSITEMELGEDEISANELVTYGLIQTVEGRGNEYQVPKGVYELVKAWIALEA